MGTARDERQREDKAERGHSSGHHLASLGAGISLTSLGIFALSLAMALLIHAVIAATAASLEGRQPPERVVMEIVKIPPPPPPEEPPPPVEEAPKPKPKPKTPPPPAKEPTPPPPEEAPPPPSNDTPPSEPPAEPVPLVVGVNLNSVVTGNSAGMKVQVGNTTYGNPDEQKFVPPDAVKPYAGGAEGWKPARAATISREAEVSKAYRVRYPPQLRDEGIEGAVVLRVQVTEAGKTRSAEVVKGVHPILDKLAVQAVKRFVWRPAEVDGEKVDSVVTYRYVFELYD